jgi:hypothetical protein
MAKKFDYDGDGVPNTKKDKDMADQDLNQDGRINKKDETLRQDTLSTEILGQDYGFAMRIVSGDASVLEVFTKAIDQGWTKEMFQAQLRGTAWYTDQGTEYARKAWFSKQEGGKQWEDQLKVAKDSIQRIATTLGTPIDPQQLNRFAERYVTEGWYEPSRQGLMQDALASFTDISKGNAASTSEQLRKLAYENGVSLNDTWLKETSESITRGDSNMNDWNSWVRDQAVAKHPLYADRIKAGVSVRSLASPYTQRMSALLEMDESGISLDDPYIRDAMGQIDEKGAPKAMNFTDFENKIRNDPRWEKTKNGANTLMNAVTSFSKSWGFVK